MKEWMKTCFRCNRTLPITEFYRHPQMGDGHLNKCKDCTKADTRKREQRLYSSPDTAIKERERHRLKSRKARAEGTAFRETPEHRVERLRKYRLKYPDKDRARQKLHRAIRTGKIQRQPCEVCGNPKSHGHHDDYSRPYDVKWLCVTHHSEHHVRLNNLRLIQQLTKSE